MMTNQAKVIDFKDYQKSTWQQIEALDLNVVKQRVMNAEHGLGYSQQQADAAERNYKIFLFLSYKYPDTSLSANDEIDAIWHAHILDTQRYQNDCQEIFGYFLHHSPCFDIVDPQEVKDTEKAILKTQELFKQEFGLDIVYGANLCNKKCAPVKS